MRRSSDNNTRSASSALITEKIGRPNMQKFFTWPVQEKTASLLDSFKKAVSTFVARQKYVQRGGCRNMQNANVVILHFMMCTMLRIAESLATFIV